MNAPFPMLTGKGNGTATLVLGALVMWAVVAYIKRQDSGVSSPSILT